jgi:hypothetical protein
LADIFLSYTHVDRPRAQSIVDLLEEQGVDRRGVPAPIGRKTTDIIDLGGVIPSRRFTPVDSGTAKIQAFIGTCK